MQGKIKDSVDDDANTSIVQISPSVAAAMIEYNESHHIL